MAIATVVAVTYLPALGVGFWMDDYIAIDIAGRVHGVDYLQRYFDPFMQRLWYRPMIGMQWKLEYLIFGGDPVGYHVVQVLFHLANSILLFGIVKHITRKWHIGLVAALVYAPLPLASMAVYWPSVHDPLAGVFWLLAILFWIGYLESGARLQWGLALISFVGALLTKEVSVTLPVVLFLADRFLVSKQADWVALMKRYAMFVPLVAVYAIFELIVIRRSEFTGQIGYSVGAQNISVFLRFLSLLALPWNIDETITYGWLLVVVLVLLYFCLRDRRLIFLVAAGILPMTIVVPIPAHLFNPRYLYLPLMAAATGFGLLMDIAIRACQRWRWSVGPALLGLMLVLVTLYGSATIAEQATNFGGYVRQIRLQFRPIYAEHPTFPADTFLYFLDTPLQTLDISGLMFLHYGSNVSVGGVDIYQVAELHKHYATFLCYLDSKGLFKTLPVDKDSTQFVSPSTPVKFENSIYLDRVEIASTSPRPGNDLVLLLYWRAAAPPRKDYTIFAHLIDAQGKIVSSLDTQPRRGLLPTSSWRINYLIPDGLALTIDPGIAPGTYTVELGLYELASMQRLALIDKDGLPIGDKIIIGPVEIGE